MKVVSEIRLLLHLLNCSSLYLTVSFPTYWDLALLSTVFLLGDNHLAGVDAHMDKCAIKCLFLVYLFDVDDVFLRVRLLDHFANLLALVVSLGNLNFIMLSNGNRSNIVLCLSSLGREEDVIFPWQ